MVTEHDLVIRGARTIDPETSLDAVCDVAIDGAAVTVVAIGGDINVLGRTEIDGRNRVLSPGFIDLHSHCEDLPSRWLQVCDGVTTALELEAGHVNVAAKYDAMALTGSPTNYGYSANWAVARMATCGLNTDVGRDVDPFMHYISDPGWHRALTSRERSELLDRLESELADGALGIGILLGYCQESSGDEYVDLARLAADTSTATYTHVRELGRLDSGLFGAAEAVTAALTTGAHMHLCHINSTSTRMIDDVHELLGRAASQGLKVTTEAYPYGAGSTGIGAAFLAPEALKFDGLEVSDIRYLPTGERLESVERLEELRRIDPAGLAVIDFLKEWDATDLGYLTRAFLAPDTAVASDAMPLVPPAGINLRESQWPLPDGVLTHPRTAGTFSRILRWYVRELEIIDLPEAIRRCTLVPADVLGAFAPSMKKKGRIQVGADADLVLFDAERISDRATYDQPTLISEGIDEVIIGGVRVVREGSLDTDARPGRPIRAVVE